MSHLMHVAPEQLVVAFQSLHKLFWRDDTCLFLGVLDLKQWQKDYAVKIVQNIA